MARRLVRGFILGVLAASLGGCRGDRPWNQPLPQAVAAERLGPPSYEGQVDTIDCNTVHGWVRDTNAPGSRVMVSILVDGQPIGTAIANEYRRDLAEAGKGDGSHAFTFPLPVTVQDSLEHRISVQVGVAPTELPAFVDAVNCPFRFPEHLKEP